MEVKINDTAGATPQQGATVQTVSQPTAAADTGPAANGLYYITDIRNRKIGLRKLDFIEEFRVVEMLGKLADNQTYMKMANPLLTVAEIDGVRVDIPRTKLQLDALIQRVGADGYTAVLVGMLKYFNQDNAELEQQIKNAVGTQALETDSGS